MPNVYLIATSKKLLIVEFVFLYLDRKIVDETLRIKRTKSNLNYPFPVKYTTFHVLLC